MTFRLRKLSPHHQLGLALVAGLAALVLWWSSSPSPAPEAAWRPDPETRGPDLLLGRPLNLNRASAAELALVADVGPGRARTIIAWRTEHGPLTGPDDLRRIPGLTRRSRDNLIRAAGWNRPPGP